MGRASRPNFDRAIVHAYTRGNNRSPVFVDDFDYTAWLRLLHRTVRRFGWTCHAFCLMPNHYHLLLESSRARISAGMRHLNGSFATRVNLRYDRTGHVFEGPYREQLVTEQRHLAELARYIPLNPVRARLSATAEDWRPSSYRATAGLERRPPYLTVTLLRSLFGRGEEGIAGYRAFVAEGATIPRATSRDLVRGRGGFGR